MEVDPIFVANISMYIGIQLIILGVYHCFFRKTLEIGALCLIAGTSTMYGLFLETMFNDLLINILFGDYRMIMVPSLLFLYLLKRAGNNSIKKYIKHLCISGSLIVAFIIIKFAFPQDFKEHIDIILPSFWLLYAGIVLYYLIIGIRYFLNLKRALVVEAFKKFTLIYASLGILLFLLLLSLMGNVIMYKKIYVGTIAPNNIMLLANLLNILILNVILIFSVLEIEQLKSFFIQNVSNRFDTLKNEQSLETFVNNVLIASKSFTETNFNAKEYLRKYKINEKQLRLYLKKEYAMTIHQFIQKLRLEEFAVIYENPEYNKYDISALAQMVGFKSKGTFYRVFKEFYQTTPKKKFRDSRVS